ncbi:MAG: HAD family hydrolase [Kofleriaceae bacterium]
MVRALLLDLDDTLFDRTAAFEGWLAARLGRAARGDELRDWLAIDQRGRRCRRAFAADAAARGVTVDAERFPFELADHVAPEPGAREALERLAARLRIAVVTNGGGAQRAKLARLGLAELVHEVFVSGELGVAKPDVAMFERALAWTAHPAGEVLFAGDDPVNDLAPAAAIGMATAWRPREAWPAGIAPPAFEIERVAELEAICAGAPS